MKIKKMTMMRILVAFMSVLLLLGTVGCRDGADTEEGETLPDLENNVLATLDYTSIWYMQTMFDVENGVEYTDQTRMLRIVALFNDLTFEPMPADKTEEIYLEMMDAQYLLLEGGGTVLVGENGRVLLTTADGGSMITDVAAMDPQALRDLIASFSSEEEQGAV
ncbi:MAG: hypothetical protein IJW40_07840 [Clostridia bacterium]|nr:hypothetical protein [Clostridia bacterium]